MFNGFYINKNGKRIMNIMIVFIFVFIILSVRLYFLQTRPTEKVASQYQNQQIENISNILYPVLDSKGKNLLEFKKKYVLVIDKKPFKLNNYEDSLQDLMALNFIMKNEDSNFNYSDIIMGEGKVYYYLSEETYNKIKKLKNLKGIYVYVYDEQDKKNAWTLGNMFSNITEKDIEAIKEKDKQTKDREIDKNSIEETIYNEIKNNSLPKMDFYLDDRAIYSQSKLNGVEENKGIRLTIDKDIQDKVDTVLSNEKYSAYKNIGVTIMETKTGKIRTMTQKDESQPNVNLVIQGMGYEPGSIYKVLTLATALEEGDTTMWNTFTCEGKKESNREYHGKLTIAEAFSKSCNDTFAAVGSKVGYEKEMEYAKKLGLYNRVLDIRRDNGREANPEMPASTQGIDNISIGQSMTTTSVQMLGAINAVVNDGVYVKPYILQDIVDGNDNVVKSFTQKGERVFSSSTSKMVKNAMIDVVVNGTGKLAYIDGVTIGGKTGTATTSKDNINHLWFAGYFTINNVEYTMIVLIPEYDKAKVDLGGGSSAAPIFKDVVTSLRK